MSVYATGDTDVQHHLSPGDEIHGVDGVDLSDMSQAAAWSLLKSLPDGPITLTIVRRRNT